VLIYYIIMLLVTNRNVIQYYYVHSYMFMFLRTVTKRQAGLMMQIIQLVKK